MASKDVVQEIYGKLKRPEFRVWLKPKSGKSVFYYRFKSIEEAKRFAKRKRKRYYTERPVVAYKGYEFSLSEFLRKYGKRKKRRKRRR